MKLIKKIAKFVRKSIEEMSVESIAEVNSHAEII